MKLLRAVAETLGADRLARELEVAIVPLGGYSRASEIEPFRWLNVTVQVCASLTGGSLSAPLLRLVVC